MLSIQLAPRDTLRRMVTIAPIKSQASSDYARSHPQQSRHRLRALATENRARMRTVAIPEFKSRRKSELFPASDHLRLNAEMALDGTAGLVKVCPTHPIP
jgi:hypothetical protein